MNANTRLSLPTILFYYLLLATTVLGCFAALGLRGEIA
jgi:hypothetical protein